MNSFLYDALHMSKRFNLIKVSRTRDNLIFITQPRAQNCVKLRQNTCVCVCLVLLEFKDDDLKRKCKCKNA